LSPRPPRQEKTEVVQPAHQKHLSYLDVLGEYITRNNDLTYVQRYFVPKIRVFESKGMDRGTNVWSHLWAR